MALETPPKTKRSLHGAVFVAAGIFLSRIAGLVRMRALAHFLGNSEAADAFYAAIKIPNFPQNLLGEGVLSASFIPVYANLVAKGDKEAAGKLAGVILALLTLVVSLVTLFGILLTPLFIDLVAPGFEGAKRELTIQLVRIIFPATGLLVISAWCLGILNSHHKFFLSYVAPVFSNLTVVAVLLLFRHEPLQSNLAIYAAWGLVVGALGQLLVQVPSTLKLVPQLKLGLSTRLEAVRAVLKSFVPVVFSRGVVQISAYVDSILASFLPSGAVAALGYAQAIYMLPISLFGMSVSAAELPAMSQAYGAANLHETLRTRINNASRKVAFFVVPSVAAFLILGDVVAGLLFQTGQFTRETSVYVWIVLAGSSVGLLASTLGRLYSSAFYALRDTRTPLRYSLLRVILATVLGYLMGLKVPGWLGMDESWGAAGITAAAGISGWIEFFLLRRRLNAEIGKSGVPHALMAKLWVASIAGAAAGFGAKLLVPDWHPIPQGLVVVGVFGCVYFPATALLGVEEAKRVFGKVAGRLGR